MTISAPGIFATTVIVRHAVVYNEIELSQVAPWWDDYAPVCNSTDLVGGGVSLQGSAREKREWQFTCVTESEAEIAALAALKGQRLTLNVDGVLYPNVMIAPPFKKLVATPGHWSYAIGFRQELILS